MYAIRLIVNLTIMIVVVAVVSKIRPEKAGITFLLYVAGQFFTCVCVAELLKIFHYYFILISL